VEQQGFSSIVQSNEMRQLMAKIVYLNRAYRPESPDPVVVQPAPEAPAAALEEFESESARIEMSHNLLKCQDGLKHLAALGLKFAELDRLTGIFEAELRVFNEKLPPPEHGGQPTKYHNLPADEVQAIAELEGRSKTLAFDVQKTLENAGVYMDVSELVAELDVKVDGPRQLFVTRAKAHDQKLRRVIEFAANPRLGIEKFEAKLRQLRKALEQLAHEKVDQLLSDLQGVRELHDAAKSDFCEFLEVVIGGKVDAPAP
jgi:hypothetical protein